MPDVTLATWSNAVMTVTSDAGRLKSGQLATWDLTVSTVANIGPGIDFYFAFGVIAVTAGVAAPLTIVAAGIAVVFLATTVAEFTRAEPSAGSFITYVETGLGSRAGVVTALGHERGHADRQHHRNLGDQRHADHGG